MKIIKKGKINNIVTCDFCECEYEFDVNDVKKASSINTIGVFTTNNHEYKYVECPCCGHKYYLQKPQKLSSINITGNFGDTSTIEKNTSIKPDKIIYKSGEVTLKDGITGIIGDALTTITKEEGNNGK